MTTPAPEQPFATPAEGRAFALAVVAVQNLGLSCEVFRVQLARAIDDRPGQPYYLSWLDALEAVTNS